MSGDVMIYFVTLAFVLLGIIQIPGLLKQKLMKELVVYILLMTIALAYSYSEILDWKLASPSSFIEAIYDPIAHLIYGPHIE